MSAVVIVTICLILTVAGIPALFCVGYLVFVYGGDAFDYLADKGIDAGERIAETIDRTVFGK